jgi:hypothetical protein
MMQRCAMWLNLMVDYAKLCHVNDNLDTNSRPHVVYINTKPRTHRVLHNSMTRSMGFSSTLAPILPHLTSSLFFVATSSLFWHHSTSLSPHSAINQGPKFSPYEPRIALLRQSPLPLLHFIHLVLHGLVVHGWNPRL